MTHFLSGLGWAALGAVVWTAPQWWGLMSHYAQVGIVAIGAMVVSIGVIIGGYAWSEGFTWR